MFCCSCLAAGASVTLWCSADFFFFLLCSKKYTFLRFYKLFLQRGNWCSGNGFSEKVSHPNDLALVFKERLSVFVKRFSLWQAYFPYMYCLYKYLQSNWTLFFAVLLPCWLDLVMDLLFVISLLNFCGDTRSTLWFHCSFLLQEICCFFAYRHIMSFPSVPLNLASLGRESNCSDLQYFSLTAKGCFFFEKDFQHYLVSAYHSEVCFVNTWCLIIPHYFFCSVTPSVFLIGWLR